MEYDPFDIAQRTYDEECREYLGDAPKAAITYAMDPEDVTNACELLGGAAKLKVDTRPAGTWFYFAEEYVYIREPGWDTALAVKRPEVRQ